MLSGDKGHVVVQGKKNIMLSGDKGYGCQRKMVFNDVRG